MPAKKTKAASKAEPTRKAKPGQSSLAGSRYVVVDLGEEMLSKKEKEEIVHQDRVQRLFSGMDSPAHANLDAAVKPILFRRMLQKKSKEEIECLDRVQRLHLDLFNMADTHPDEATELILYALLRLPQEFLRRVRERVQLCQKVLDRERAELGPGKPKGQEKPTVLLRWVSVAFLKHVKELT